MPDRSVSRGSASLAHGGGLRQSNYASGVQGLDRAAAPANLAVKRDSRRTERIGGRGRQRGKSSQAQRRLDSDASEPVMMRHPAALPVVLHPRFVRVTLGCPRLARTGLPSGLPSVRHRVTIAINGQRSVRRSDFRTFWVVRTPVATAHYSSNSIMPVITEAVPSAGPVLKPSDFKSAIPAIIVGLAAAFGGFLYGYDTGTISGIIAMPYFREQFGQYYPDNIPSNFDFANPDPGYDLSTANQSLVVSILSAGTFFGALLGAPLADGLGRKLGMQVALIIFCAGVAMQTASTAVPLLAAGRAIAGLGVGIISTIVPMYQSETAPRWIRGAVVSAYQWAITIGLLIAAIVNNSTQTYMDTRSYRIPIAIQIGFAAILSFFFFLLPESPRWYIKKGNHEAARKSLARLNSSSVDDPIILTEADLIQKNLDIELQHGTGSYLECFANNERKYLLRTMTGIFLQAWQQLTGINFIFYYGTKFFKTAVPNGDAYHFVIISNVINVIMTVPGMWWMDYIGRRDILVAGALWMTVCELIVAVVGTVEPTSNAAAGKSLVAFVCLYIAAFASTWGPAAWVVCGEIFPLAIRAKALSLCVASNWLWNFGIGYATPYLVNSGDGYAGLGTKVFFIWTATCFCSAIYAFLLIYETKGLSLEEVDEMYAYAKPLQSKRANGEIRARRIDVEGKSYHVKDDESATESAKRDDVKVATE